MALGGGGLSAPGRACAKREKGNLRPSATAPGATGVRPLECGARGTGGIYFFAEKNAEALHGTRDSGSSDGAAGAAGAREAARPERRQPAGGLPGGARTRKRHARPAGGPP